MSNFAAPPQLVENVPYRDVAEMHRFAKQWRDEHRKQWFITPKLSGFCLLLKRAVYDKIGGLDERFGLGLFDDDDLAERARRAGFELAVAHDLFVHHFGSRTFRGNGIDAGELFEENARRFAAKWGLKDQDGGRERVFIKPWRREVENGDAEGDPIDVGLAFRPDLQRTNSTVGGQVAPGREGAPPEGQAMSINVPGDGAVPAVDRARVSLTMIVKNEQENLPRCLASVEGIFDEIIVVDTGSTDRTREIALEFGAKVFDFAWIDDFAAARNECFSHATGDYVFWLDADDVVEPAERVKLVALLAGLKRPARTRCLPVPPPGARPRAPLPDGERRPGVLPGLTRP